jgi:hypothetical protein
MNSKWTKSFITGCALAAALTGTACNRHDAAEVDRDNDRLAADTTKDRGHEGAPITVTGCLQRGTSGIDTYILTQVNSPSETPVATAGKDASGAAVQREQMREAKHSYALDNGDKDVMRDMVGKQVRVNGTIKEASELHKEAAKTSTDRDRRLDIDAGDLAKIDVQGVVQIAEECGKK